MRVQITRWHVMKLSACRLDLLMCLISTLIIPHISEYETSACICPFVATSNHTVCLYQKMSLSTCFEILFQKLAIHAKSWNWLSTKTLSAVVQFLSKWKSIKTFPTLADASSPRSSLPVYLLKLLISTPFPINDLDSHHNSYYKSSLFSWCLLCLILVSSVIITKTPVSTGRWDTHIYMLIRSVRSPWLMYFLSLRLDLPECCRKRVM